MKDLKDMLKQAQDMQQSMSDMHVALENATIEGSSGAGMVKITMDGKGALKSVTIDPALFSGDEKEVVEDLIVAAHADAKGRVEAYAAEEMKKITGGIQLPPGMNLNI
jgi:DNA-binding YbaB/EbfC family protein